MLDIKLLQFMRLLFCHVSLYGCHSCFCKSLFNIMPTKPIGSKDRISTRPVIDDFCGSARTEQLLKSISLKVSGGLLPQEERLVFQPKIVFRCYMCWFQGGYRKPFLFLLVLGKNVGVFIFILEGSWSYKANQFRFPTLTRQQKQLSQSMTVRSIHKSSSIPQSIPRYNHVKVGWFHSTLPHGSFFHVGLSCYVWFEDRSKNQNQPKRHIKHTHTSKEWTFEWDMLQSSSTF